MDWLILQIEQHGAWIIAGAIFAEELGAPVPAAVLLVIAGALVFAGKLGIAALVVAVLGAAAAANLLWFFAGRKFGYRILGILCRISLSQDSCVRQSQSIFDQWGGFALLFAKFVPALSAVTPPMAGAANMSVGRFLVYDLLGMLALLLVCAGSGYVFHDTINQLLATLSQAGTSAVVLLVGLLALFIFYKWLRRLLFIRSLRTARITVDELSELMHGETTPLIVDVRNPALQRDGKIPGAVTLSVENLEQQLEGLPETSEVILYCSCPNEATAAQIAVTLIRKGYSRVRPLKGGVAAWQAAGLGLEMPADMMQ